MFPSEALPAALKGFEILNRLGSGGAGDVYLARSKGGRLVAIKVLSDAKGGTGPLSQALVREASLCVRLSHPAIVQVRALIEEEGFAAIVFDYLEGIALDRLIRFCAAAGVRLPDAVGWYIVERVLSALSFAHKQTDEAYQPAPIVHRDVSPSNVLLGWDGTAQLTDFGIAKMLGVSPATQFGLVKGTLGCMAPEQARGEPVDERADVYAAGLLAWRLATGRNPLAGYADEIEVLRAMRNPRLKPLSALRPDLPEALVLAVQAALAPAPQDRTLTAEGFAKVVRESLDVGGGQATLAALLSRCRETLERPVLSKANGERGPSRAAENKPENQTGRYEDARLDDVVDNGRTVEVEALPGDEARWSALGRSVTPLGREAERRVDVALPALPLSGPRPAERPAIHTTSPPMASRNASVPLWGLALVVLGAWVVWWMVFRD